MNTFFSSFIADNISLTQCSPKNTTLGGGVKLLLGVKNLRDN